MVTDTGGNGVLLENAGAVNHAADQAENSNADDDRNQGYKSNGISFQFFPFLLFLLLLFRKHSGLLLLAELFLAGCAHVINSSHFAK